MDVSVDIDALRRKHKTELVERALRIYRPTDAIEETAPAWVDFLLSTGNVGRMIECLKNGGHLPDSFMHGNQDGNAREPLNYAGTAALDQRLESLRAGMPEKLQITITNHSSSVWQNTESTPINASYHWLDQDGAVVQFDGVRTPLPEPIPPGRTIALSLNVTPPSKAGRYQLLLSLVHEGICWFEERGFEATSYPVEIEWCLPASTARVLDEMKYLRGILQTEEQAN